MNYTKELNFAKKLALKAGEMMVKGFANSSAKVKSDLSPVTETDLAISKFVIREIANKFPDHSVLDEEFQNTYSDAENLWICDPIDGTIPFAHNVPTSMFSLAFCKNSEPVVAVMYDPYMKRLLWTTQDSPSYMNDQIIQVKKGNFRKGEFLYGIPYWLEDFDVNTYVKALDKKDILVTYIESIVYQGMLVAAGITKAMITIAANPWDRVAVRLIVENAGGKCTDETGNRLPIFGKPKILIVSNGDVHDEMLSIVKQCLP